MSAAARALERFSVDPALAGDLLQERRNGRSWLWLWSQVLTAIVLATVCFVRQHSWIVLRGVTLGVAIIYLLQRFAFSSINAFAPWERQASNWLLESGRTTVYLWWWRLHMFSFTASAIECLLLIACGWVVGALHRGMRVVAVYAAATVVWQAIACPMAFTSPFFWHDIYGVLWIFLVMPASLLAGGMFTNWRRVRPV